MNIWEPFNEIDQEVENVLGKVAIPSLRFSLGFIYLWFGLLKLLGVSPAAKLVTQTFHPIPPRVAVLLAGVWETVVGLGLITRKGLCPTLLLFFLQVIGTFMVFIRHPEQTFQNGNPLRLTQEGEFIMKNLILLAAGLVVASTADTDERVTD